MYILFFNYQDAKAHQVGVSSRTAHHLARPKSKSEEAISRQLPLALPFPILSIVLVGDSQAEAAAAHLAVACDCASCGGHISAGKQVAR